MKKSDKVEIFLDSWAAECLFGSTYLLLYLFDRERQLAFYRQFYCQEKEEKLPTKLFQGFKLAILVLLHRMISQVIEAPEIIGVKRSKKIDWAYHFGAGEKSTIYKLPNSSAQGVLVANLLIFRKKIIESKNWDNLWEATESLRDFMHPFQEIFLSSYIGNIDQSDRSLDPENALKTKLPELILIFMNDAKILHLAFKEMYQVNPRLKRTELRKIPFEPKQWFCEVPVTSNILFSM